MHVAGAITADWLGWSAAVFGVSGALLLARPLFILMVYREALDALVMAIDSGTTSDELRAKFVDTRALSHHSGS